MRRWILVSCLVLISVLGVSVSAGAQASTVTASNVTSGQVVKAAISRPGQQVKYTFPRVSAMAQSHARGDSGARAARRPWGNAKQDALPRPRVFGWGFGDPDGVSSDGTHVWVANGTGTVAELTAATGTLVKLIKGVRYGFNGPSGVSSDGTHVWVANGSGNSVTELTAATGALVQVITGSIVVPRNPFGLSRRFREKNYPLRTTTSNWSRSGPRSDRSADHSD